MFHEAGTTASTKLAEGLKGPCLWRASSLCGRLRSLSQHRRTAGLFLDPHSSHTEGPPFPSSPRCCVPWRWSSAAVTPPRLPWVPCIALISTTHYFFPFEILRNRCFPNSSSFAFRIFFLHRSKGSAAGVYLPINVSFWCLPVY